MAEPRAHENDLRGDFTFGRNEFRTNALDTGNKVNRFFYDAAVQLQYPTAVGLEPYVFAGGGPAACRTGSRSDRKVRREKRDVRGEV